MNNKINNKIKKGGALWMGDFIDYDDIFHNKPFYKSNYHKRNEEIAKYSDKVVAFCPEGKVTKGTGSALKYCEKNKKKYIIID